MEYVDFADSVYGACRLSGRVFVINPHFKHRNFYSQQLRSLALVSEMFLRGDIIPERTHVAIVGAGISGLTLAAATVTGRGLAKIYDADAPLARYLNATHRELHPNIVAWPFQEPRAMTDLPFLNWVCSPANQVAAQILDQWNAYFASEVHHERATVSNVTEDDKGVEIKFANRKAERAEIVIVAAGSNDEKGVGTFKSKSYWTLDWFDPPGEVTVGGSGDGALIDASAQFYGLKTVAASRALAYLLKGSAYKQAIEDAEGEALEALEKGDAEGAVDILHDFYEMLALPNENFASLRQYERPNPVNTRLYYRGKSVFTTKSAPINKLLLSQLAKPPLQAVELARGELKQKNDNTIYAKTAEGDMPIDQQRLIARTGNNDNTLTSILGETLFGSLERSEPALNRFATDAYDKPFFARKPRAALAPSRWNGRRFEHYSQLEGLVRSLVAHVMGNGAKVTINRLTNAKWELVLDTEANRELQDMLPIKANGVTIALDESQRRTLRRQVA